MGVIVIVFTRPVTVRRDMMGVGDQDEVSVVNVVELDGVGEDVELIECRVVEVGVVVVVGAEFVEGD